MTLYRKLPIEVEAVKWTGDNIQEVLDVLHVANHPIELYCPFNVTNVDGNEVPVQVGAYVVSDAKGFPYPCDPDIFEATHELADQPHLIKLDQEGWTLQHPLSCRPNLFDCPVNAAVQWQPLPSLPVGVYPVELVEGERLKFGEAVNSV